MMNSIFLFSMILSVATMLSVSHPLSLSALLIASALIIGALVAHSSTSWFFYLLVLVFLGGVMVLVIYMCTLCSNEKFKVGANSSVLALLIVVPLAACLPTFPSGYSHSVSMVTPPLYEYNYSVGLIFLMSFLILALICIVKMVKFEAGPLVKRL